MNTTSVGNTYSIDMLLLDLPPLRVLRLGLIVEEHDVDQVFVRRLVGEFRESVEPPGCEGFFYYPRPLGMQVQVLLDHRVGHEAGRQAHPGRSDLGALADAKFGCRQGHEGGEDV